MPATFSFLCLPFLYIRRSRSESHTGPPPRPRNGSPGTSASASSPRRMSGQPEATPNSQPSASVDSQGSVGIVFGDRVPDDSGDLRPGFFSQAHNFVRGSLVFIGSDHSGDNILREISKETIPGVQFDSFARHPPPRCHPGTRLAILKRCLSFIANCDGQQKICWVVGAAGVGKSAIMQSVAESPELQVNCHASIFFSVNGRNDGTKAVITISYQFAVQSWVYARVIEDEVTRNPTLLRSSMIVQFKKLIVEPFINNLQLNSAGRVLVVIDGLDECNDPCTQQELLHLISDFCITYPSSPIVWLIASRPEPHITSFFSHPNIIPTYEKEEIPVDSDDARADVERYLRNVFTEIKEHSNSLDPEWPEERDLWKLANASGGLFAYAHTVVRYIRDHIRDPASQLSDVLNVIDGHPMTYVPGKNHPLARLDELYARILSNVPQRFMVNTRKLLMASASDWGQYLMYGNNFSLLGNWLAMRPDEVYAAVNHLHSLLRVPRRGKAHEEKLEAFHKSFIDYISDFTRSGFSKREAQQIKTECAFRILKEAPNGIDFGDLGYGAYHGTLARGPGTGEKISLTFLADENGGWNSNETRLNMYKLAIGEVAAGMGRGDPTFQSEFCIRLLVARFRDYGFDFPHYPLRDSVFAESRREELMSQGILKQIPLDVIDISNVLDTLNEAYQIKFQFCLPSTIATGLSDPWDPSCNHKREGEWEKGTYQKWVTTFEWNDCTSCFSRLRKQLARMKMQSPDCTVPILFTSTDRCCVEFSFLDQDGRSEWKYWFWYTLSWEEREKYGSSV